MTTRCDNCGEFFKDEIYVNIRCCCGKFCCKECQDEWHKRQSQIKFKDENNQENKTPQQIVSANFQTDEGTGSFDYQQEQMGQSDNSKELGNSENGRNDGSSMKPITSSTQSKTSHTPADKNKKENNNEMQEM